MAGKALSASLVSCMHSDVGLHRGQPLLDPVEAGLQRVHVPGHEAHGGHRSGRRPEPGRRHRSDRSVDAMEADRAWSDYLCPWAYLGRDRTAPDARPRRRRHRPALRAAPRDPARGRRRAARAAGSTASSTTSAPSAPSSASTSPRPARSPNTRHVLETAEVVRLPRARRVRRVRRVAGPRPLGRGRATSAIAALVRRAASTAPGPRPTRSPSWSPTASARAALAASMAEAPVGRGHGHAGVVGERRAAHPGAQPRETIERWITKMLAAQQRRRAPASPDRPDARRPAPARPVIDRVSDRTARTPARERFGRWWAVRAAGRIGRDGTRAELHQRDRPQRLAGRRDVRAVPRRPASVSESWQEFFADYRPGGGQPRRPPGAGADAARRRGTAPPPPAPPPRPPRRRPPRRRQAGRRCQLGEPIRGAGARIVANMEASLSVPTATSFREVPAKLLEVNRTVINGYLGRTGRRQGQLHPPHRLRRRPGHRRHHAGDELALRRGRRRQAATSSATSTSASASPSTSRSPTARARCSCPCIKRRRHPRLPRLLAAYEDLIRKVRTNKLIARRLRRRHASASPTPAPSAPSSRCPASCRARASSSASARSTTPPRSQGADPATLADLGLSKVITITRPTTTASSRAPSPGCSSSGSTSCSWAPTTSTTTSSARSACPTRPSQWRRDVNPVDREQSMLEKQMQVDRPHQHAPGARPPHRRPRPAGGRRARTCTPSSTRPPTGSPSGTSTASSSPAASAASERMPLGDILHILRDAYCRTIGIEYMHIQDPEEKRWIQEQVEGVADRAHRRRAAPHPRAAQRRRGAREVPRHEVPRPEALRHRRRRVAPSRSSTPSSPRPPTPTWTPRSWAWPTAAGSTCSSTSWARATSSSSRSSRATSTPTPSRARAT